MKIVICGICGGRGRFGDPAGECVVCEGTGKRPLDLKEIRGRSHCVSGAEIEGLLDLLEEKELAAVEARLVISHPGAAALVEKAITRCRHAHGRTDGGACLFCVAAVAAPILEKIPTGAEIRALVQTVDVRDEKIRTLERGAEEFRKTIGRFGCVVDAAWDVQETSGAVTRVKMASVKEDVLLDRKERLLKARERLHRAMEKLDERHHAPLCPANHYHATRRPTGNCTCGAKVDPRPVKKEG